MWTSVCNVFSITVMFKLKPIMMCMMIFDIFKCTYLFTLISFTFIFRAHKEMDRPEKDMDE